MAGKKQNYDDGSVYPLSNEMRDLLFDLQTECSLSWSTTDGWPVGVMHRYVFADDTFWITTMSHRKRVLALRKRPKSCVIVSGENVRDGWRDFTVTAKTLCTVHDETSAGTS
ncbi:MAG: hypothetical protein P8N02_06210 [Actinomycetota bacterium]|nr:hypothetical protein [Actinomycetota bacterium]